MSEMGKARRRQERRRAAATAGVERLAAEGFAWATLEGLAQDAGLSKQSLLFYFEDKADLLAEAAACASESIFATLGRLVEGESGSTAIRALRRALDEVSRILPGPFAVFLDAATLPGANASQRRRATDSQLRFLDTLSRALAAPRQANTTSARLARFCWLGLLAPHREARTHLRSGMNPAPGVAADLDWTEAQLILLARSLLRAQ